MSTNIPPGTGAPDAPNPQDEEFYASYVYPSFLPLSTLPVFHATMPDEEHETPPMFGLGLRSRQRAYADIPVGDYVSSASSL
jgi:hypothetical protein